jgi:formate dehydrogenase accessory protein FdhE
MSGAPVAGTADPELERASELLRRLSEAWGRMPATLPHGVPALDAAAERVRNGIPALADEPLLDGAGLRDAAAAVADELARVEGFGAAGAIARRLLASSLDWDALARVALAGTWDALDGLTPELAAEADVVPALLDYAVRPRLRAAARLVRPILAETSWGRGSCPACGAPPLLSVTTGKEASRVLLCGRCGTSWGWSRGRCAACGEDDHHRLGLLHAAGEADYRRVEVCDTCRSYLKTIAALDPPDADGLLRLDLETAALDFIALDAGYTRAGGAA